MLGAETLLEQVEPFLELYLRGGGGLQPRCAAMELVPSFELVLVIGEHGLHRRIASEFVLEDRRVVALGSGQDVFAQHRVQAIGQRGQCSGRLVAIFEVAKFGVGTCEGDAHEHLDKLVQHQLQIHLVLLLGGRFARAGEQRAGPR